MRLRVILQSLQEISSKILTVARHNAERPHARTR
jgi:hypothetical protein